MVTLLITAIKTKNNTHLFLVVHKLDNKISYQIKNKTDDKKSRRRIFKGKNSFKLIPRPEESCSN